MNRLQIEHFIYQTNIYKHMYIYVCLDDSLPVEYVWLIILNSSKIMNVIITAIEVAQLYRFTLTLNTFVPLLLYLINFKLLYLLMGK